MNSIASLQNNGRPITTVSISENSGATVAGEGIDATPPLSPVTMLWKGTPKFVRLALALGFAGLAGCASTGGPGMPVDSVDIQTQTTRLEQVDQDTRRVLLDGDFSRGDALALRRGGPLTDNEKAVVLNRLRSRHLTHASSDEALDEVGITAEQVKAADGRDGFSDDVMARLREVLVDQIFNDHELLDVGLGSDAFGLKLMVGFEPLADYHPEVVGVPARYQDSGNTIWGKTYWGVKPSAGVRVAAPIGPATLNAGISADSEIQGIGITAFPVVLPSNVDATIPEFWKATKDALKRSTFNLPTTADVPMKAGEEARIALRGKLGFLVGAGAGRDLAQLLGDTVSIGARAGVQVGVSREGDFSILSRELNGEGLRLVEVSEGKKMSRSLSADANVGVRINSLPGGFVGGVGKSVANDLLEDYASTGFSFGADVTDGNRRIAVYLFDLSQGDAVRKAYDELMTLRAFDADALAEANPGLTSDDRPVNGVAYVSVDSDFTVDNWQLGGHFTALELLKRVETLSVESSGVRHTTQDVDGETQDSIAQEIGEFNVQKVIKFNQRSGLISSPLYGRQTLSRELVFVDEAETKKPLENYYHLRWETDSDKYTTGDNIRKFLMLGQRLGQPEGEALMNDAEFLGEYGVLDRVESDRVIDTYITGKGISRILERRNEIPAAVARALEDSSLALLERENHVPAPWITGDKRLMKYLTRPVHRPSPAKKQHGSQNVAGKYARLTGGRSLVDDKAAFKTVRILQGMAKELAKAPNSRVRAEAFASAVDELGTDFTLGLGAALDLAGPDGAIVREMSLKFKDGDEGEDIVFARNEGIVDPSTTIERLKNRLRLSR